MHGYHLVSVLHFLRSRSDALIPHLLSLALLTVTIPASATGVTVRCVDFEGRRLRCRVPLILYDSLRQCGLFRSMDSIHLVTNFGLRYRQLFTNPLC